MPTEVTITLPSWFIILWAICLCISALGDMKYLRDKEE